MDFLFASQDASTASLVWLTCLLAERPDVLQKVRLVTVSSPSEAVLLQAAAYHTHRNVPHLPITAVSRLL